MTMVLMLMNDELKRDWCFIAEYDTSGDDGKGAERPQLDNLLQWLIYQSRSFTRKNTKKVTRSVRT